MAVRQKTEPDVTVDNGTPAQTETKQERFLRLINKRLAKADKAMRHVANLGNRATYEYTETQRLRVQELVSEFSAAAYNAFELKQRAVGEEQNYI